MVSAAGLLNKTLNAVKKVGVQISVYEDLAGTYNPTTGKVEGATTTTYANVWSSPPIDYRKFYKTDSPLKEGTAVLGIPAKSLAFIPKTGMRLTMINEDWVIQLVNPVIFQSTVIAYNLDITRG